MRLSIVAAALSLVTGILADGIMNMPPPPPGSACAVGAGTYREPKSKARPGEGAAPAIVETQKRSLGITSLPRRWARDLLGPLDGYDRNLLGCACVHPGREKPFGFFKKYQCPEGDHGRGAVWASCSLEEDGSKVKYALKAECNQGNGRDTDVFPIVRLSGREQGESAVALYR